MNAVIENQWEIFIVIEIISFLSLLLFGIIRYFFGKQGLSFPFLLLFIVLLILEAALAIVIFKETGEISTFQMVITIFVLYACTFGIADFKKLDRWMRLKIGNLRKIDLLTEKDRAIMDRQKDPKYVAKKNRYSSMIHLVVFFSVQAVFWWYGTKDVHLMLEYLFDFSWVGTENVKETPYANEIVYQISTVWAIVFAIDFIYSWSYTIFPETKKA